MIQWQSPRKLIAPVYLACTVSLSVTPRGVCVASVQEMDSSARASLMGMAQRNLPKHPMAKKRPPIVGEHKPRKERPSPPKLDLAPPSSPESLPQLAPPRAPSLPPKALLGLDVSPPLPAAASRRARPAAGHGVVVAGLPSSISAPALRPALPPLVDSAQVADASRDISFLTDFSPGWRERAAAGAHEGAHSSPRDMRLPRGYDLARAADLSMAVDQEVDPSDPHGWYKAVFESRMPAGRRDAVLVSRWLDRMEAEEAAGGGGDEGGEGAGGGGMSGEALDGSADGARKPLAFAGSTTTRRVEQLSAAFDELVRQVSVNCIERGQALTRVWQKLAGSMEHLLALEGSHEKAVAGLERQLRAEQLSTVRLTDLNGELRERVRALEAHSRWTGASIRIRRYQDTLKWRTAFAMAMSERDKLKVQLEELRKANAALALKKLVERRHSDSEGDDDDDDDGDGSAPGGEAAVDPAELNRLIAESMKAAPPRAEAVEARLSELASDYLAPSIAATERATFVAVGLSNAQQKRAARRLAESQMVDSLLTVVAAEVDEDLSRTRGDLAAATRQSREMANMAADLKRKNGYPGAATDRTSWEISPWEISPARVGSDAGSGGLGGGVVCGLRRWCGVYSGGGAMCGLGGGAVLGLRWCGAWPEVVRCLA